MFNLQQTSRVYGNGEIKSIRNKNGMMACFKNNQKEELWSGCECVSPLPVSAGFQGCFDLRSHSFSQPLMMTVCRSASRWPGIFPGFLSLVFYLSFLRAEASWLACDVQQKLGSSKSI